LWQKTVGQEIMNKEIEKIDGYISGDTINLNVQNIDEFKELIAQIKEKEKELNELVFKLSRFDLKIKLNITKD